MIIVNVYLWTRFAMVLKIVQTNLMKRGVSLNADVVASTIFSVETVKAI